MKVLKLGRVQNGYSVEAECTGFGNGGGGCGALLLVEQDDMRYYPGVPGDTWGSRDPAVSFRCCDCGVITDLPKKLEPSSNICRKLKRFTNRWRDGKDDDLSETEE